MQFLNTLVALADPGEFKIIALQNSFCLFIFFDCVDINIHTMSVVDILIYIFMQLHISLNVDLFCCRRR